ncbi:hypothetical protein [Adhaeribacter radiodurans]|uniref:Uncharacterized protein n=1 Tax=Adhaeribacter radiodurans TaxID=2745197 RepID=A0A7L7L1L5_9BACT|nr:hypothetical protein [Adhaeribacter radiodurans]QMU26495.1 hypothetical protein HUW48_00025 [Adhaeribacter radiodurans]
MEHMPEEIIRPLLQKNYDLLESYSNELEKSDLQEKRIDEIFTQVRIIAEQSRLWLDTLVTTTSCAVHSESLESSLNHLQYANVEAESPNSNRRTILKRILYYSRLALLSPWGLWQVIGLNSL